MNIIDEFQALALVPVAEWTARGIPKAVDVVLCSGGIRQARARFAFEPSLGRYCELTSDGLPCWAVGAYEAERLVDIVAWPMGRPRQHARLYRRAWGLGGDEATDPNRIGSDPEIYPPIYVYRDPMGWLQSGGKGLVILDAERAREELWYAGELRAEDEHHGREIEHLMRPPKWRGRICVPAMGQVA